MIHPTICPQCLQPNESSRSYCWKCTRSFQHPPTVNEYERLFALGARWTHEDLKRAYHRVAMETHPDKHPGDRESDAKFQFVNRAYEELCAQGHSHPPIAPHPESHAPPATKTNDPTIDRLAEMLHEFYVSRYSSEPRNRSQAMLGIFVLILIVSFYGIMEWASHHYGNR